MAAGDVFQMTAVAIQHAQPVASVFYIEVLDDTGTTDAMADAAAAFENQVLVEVLPILSDEWVMECLLSRRMAPTTSPQRVFPSSLAGGTSGQAMPSNVAVVFRHYSGTGLPTERGRIFQSGLAEGYISEGRLWQNLNLLIPNFITRMTSTITDSGRTYRMKHYSKKLKQFFDIESMVLAPVPTKIRNRTPGLCSIS